MTSPTKPNVNLTVKPTALAKVKKVTKATAPPVKNSAMHEREPFLRFFHSAELRDRFQDVLTAIEASADSRTHADELANLVADLTSAGMDHYFMKALKLANVGFVSEQSARLGMSGAVKLIGSVSRKFIVRMNHTQLVAVAGHMRVLAK